MFEHSTRQELLDGISAVYDPPPSTEVVPLPAQANRAAMSPAAQETAFEEWVSWINSRPNTTWQRDEIAAVRFGIKRALRTL
jgi:hypothetical protein